MHIERLQNNKHKTNEILIALTVKLEKETVTKSAILPQVLRRGNKKYINQLEMNKKLEEMYGANLTQVSTKNADYITIKFYLLSLANKYVPSKENIAQSSMNLLFNTVFNPLVENGGFKKEYVKQEKENLRKIIMSRKDDKQSYAYERCIEEMFKNKPFGIDANGLLEKLDEINEKNLYEYYLNVLKNARIDIYINGEDANEIVVPEIDFENNEIDVEEKFDTFENNEPNVVKESGNVTQGKLNIGLEIESKNKFANLLYSTVLGGGANSKLFQNVREKASLAYYASARYLRRKNVIIIVTGIELENYDKALKIIKEQIEETKKENITDEEFESAKTLIISSLKTLKESQTNETAFIFDQKLFNDNLTIDECEKQLEKVTKQDVIEASRGVKINTIYFLEK